MIAIDFVRSIAALLAWREERSNGINGMFGVLFVVRNRVNAKWQGGDWLQNIEAHGQFSSMSIIGDSQTVAYPNPNEPNFQYVLQNVDSVVDGTMPDNLTNGALYYADLNSSGFAHGGWFDRNILQQPNVHPRCATIGSTTYFK